MTGQAQQNRMLVTFYSSFRRSMGRSLSHVWVLEHMEDVANDCLVLAGKAEKFHGIWRFLLLLNSVAQGEATCWIRMLINKIIQVEMIDQSSSPIHWICHWFATRHIVLLAMIQQDVAPCVCMSSILQHFQTDTKWQSAPDLIAGAHSFSWSR